VSAAVAVLCLVAIRDAVAPLELAGVAAATTLVWWLVRQRARDADRRRLRLAVIALCDALAAELRAGLPAATALARACGEDSPFAPVTAAAQLGGDVPAAFRLAGERPGGEGLRAVAAGWSVASQSGASLAGVLDRVCQSLRDQQDAAAEVEAALGPPRATARMLAALPAMGILLGTAMGARPLAFLAQTSAGRMCLVTGVALALSGVAWVERLAAGAERA
jgi:tight adherence protein B